MTKKITVEGLQYRVTDELHVSMSRELIFELQPDRNSDQTIYVVGFWNDFLGSPVKKVWSIVEKEQK